MSSWPTARLGEVARWGSGGTPPRDRTEFFGAGIPWLAISDLNDGIVDSAAEQLTMAGIQASSAKIVPPGAVLVAMYGSIGKLAIAGTAMCTSQAIAFAIPDPKHLYNRYLFHYLRSQRAQLTALGRGGTQKNIGQGILKKLSIPLPPLPEQRRIAAILDEADALASRAAAEEASASEYADSSFSTVFGQTTVYQTTLGLVANVTSGITKGRKLNGQATREVPYLAVSNVQAGFLDMRVVKTIDATEDEIARLRLRDGDLLLTEGGDPDKLGRGTLWRDELPLCLHQNHVFRVRLPEDSPLTPGFLAGYLRSSEARTYFLRSAKQTTGIASINMTQLKALPVPLPEKDEQERYLNSLKAIGPMQAQMTRRSTLLTELFASLQSRAFSGQL